MADNMLHMNAFIESSIEITSNYHRLALFLVLNGVDEEKPFSIENNRLPGHGERGGLHCEDELDGR